MRKLGLVLYLLLAVAITASATTMLSLDAADLARRAERIFEGDVVAVAHVMDENRLPVMLVTVHVTEGIKHTIAGETVTFKQIDELIPGLPHYQSGEHVLLFLSGTSSWGLSAPIGLGQGCFRSARDVSGRRLLVNEFDNRELFQNSRALAASEELTPAERQMVGQREGPVGRDSFIRFLRRAAVREVAREQ